VFPTLLSPLDRGRLHLKNRVVFPGHQTLLSRDGKVGDRLLGYYLERAKGGVGAVVVEGAAVHPSTIKFPWYLLAYDGEIVPTLDALAAALHEYDCRVFVQLAHSGSRMSTQDSRQALWAPSAIKSAIATETPHAMTQSEIVDLVESYGVAAGNVARSQADGVEVHAAHEYLLGEFLSPLSNRRKDEYGGSLDNRLRLLIEVLERVRAAVGDTKVVGLRMNGSDLIDGGLTSEDYVEIAQRITALGILDYISVTAGTSSHNHLIVPPMDVAQGVYVDYAAAIRDAVDVPVFAVGRIKHPEHAEAVLAAGQADVVAIARALIADPYWVSKAASAPEQIRPCIGCNQGCFGNLYLTRPITCTVNPAVGLEEALGVGTNGAPPRARRVGVVGGGPAGMEAAIAAAERGHQVVLYERSGALGGQALLAGSVPARRELLDVIQHQRDELDRLGVHVRLGVVASADALAEQQDVVVVATGSTPRRPDVAVRGQIPVVTSTEALASRDTWRDKRVVLLDEVGHFPAYVAAEALVDNGATVTLVTARLHAGGGLDQATLATMHQRLGGKGVVFQTHTALVAVQPSGAVLRDVFNGHEWTEPADLIVAAIGADADDGLLTELTDRGDVEVLSVGDCVAPRTMLEAIREGRLAGRAV